MAAAAAAAGNASFRAAIDVLKVAAKKDAAYKKEAEADRPSLIVDVVVQYSVAEARLAAALASGNVQGTVKAALEGKLEAVKKRKGPF